MSRTLSGARSSSACATSVDEITSSSSVSAVGLPFSPIALPAFHADIPRRRALSETSKISAMSALVPIIFGLSLARTSMLTACVTLFGIILNTDVARILEAYSRMFSDNNARDLVPSSMQGEMQCLTTKADLQLSDTVCWSGWAVLKKKGGEGEGIKKEGMRNALRKEERRANEIAREGKRKIQNIGGGEGR